MSKKAVYGKDRMPAKVQPMLCILVREMTELPGYLYEMKWDGYRIVAYKHGSKVRLDSRGGLDYTAKYPLVANALTALGHDA